MAAPTQKGQEMLVGFGDFSFAGYFMESVDKEPTADVEKIKDEHGATSTVIISDPGVQISGSMMAKAAIGSAVDAQIDARKIGDTFTMNEVGYRIESWKVSRSRGVTKADFTAVKEDSMNYA